jgi:hypothetical protein
MSAVLCRRCNTLLDASKALFSMGQIYCSKGCLAQTKHTVRTCLVMH